MNNDAMAPSGKSADRDDAPVVIVQARMSSARLPGKVLRPLAGKPMLGWLLERLERCRSVAGVAVATSEGPDDDPVAVFCAGRGTICLRGPLDDVAGRYLLALDRLGAAAFVRVSGDSPLLDPAIVDRAVALFRTSGADLATNVLRRTFPKGQSVEVVRGDAFRRACAAMMTAEQREHVTRFFYEHPDAFRIADFTDPRGLGALQLSVDTPAEFAAMERLVGAMAGDPLSYGLDDIIALLEGLPA